jgi:hypothetical protein
MAKKKNANIQMNSFFSDMASHLPGFVTFNKVLGEFLEHKEFAMWVFVRVVIPIILFNALVNLVVFERFRLSPTIFGIAIFFYSTFLVDLDSFFNSRSMSKEATPVQKILILFFAPVVIYYMLSKKLRPLHLPQKYFHRKKSLLLFCLFAFVVGWIIFFNLPDALFFVLFAFTGYVTHLLVDRVIVLGNFKV